MRKTPGFTAVVVLTLALGIGANTAIFSVVHALVLRSLPVKDPSQLVAVAMSSASRGVTGAGVSLASYETMRDGSWLLAGLAAYCGDTLTLSGGDDPEQLVAARVSPNFFEVLGTQPNLGRRFTAEEGTPSGARVAMISHGLWQRRFAGDRQIIGRAIILDQDPYTIIGVLPQEYPFPNPGIDVWVTRVMNISVFQPEQIQNGIGYLRLLGRLSPGVSLSQTAEELQALHVQYKREHPRAPDGTPDSRMGALPLQDSLTAGIKPTLMILSGAVAFVLLIACANVAGLMMARATARAKEMAVRAALGASRMQLAWQLLSESLVLSVAGAALGVLFAKWGVAWLVASDAGNDLPGYQPIGLNLVVLAFAAASSVATGAAFGLVPAMQASRPDLNGALRDGGWGSTGGVHRHRLRSTLVAAQIGVSVILLIGAGLLIESFRQVQNVKLGFNPERTLVGHVSLPPAKYPEGPRRAAFVREVAERLERSAGVKSVALSLTVPMLNLLRTPILAEGQDFVALGQRPLVEWNIVAPGFFRTYGVPMMSGRDFTWAEDVQAPRVVIVNQALARRFWAGENPLGKHVVFTRSQTPYEVVGVVGDTRSGNLEGPPPMAMYSSYAQGTWPRLSIGVRAAGDPAAMSKLLSAQIAAVDRDLPVANIQTMEQVVANTLAQRKETMYLIAGFAGLALVLAAIGLYGVMAYSVAQRTAEIGIRQAIGAQRTDILRMVMLQGLRLSLAGIVVGTAAAAVLMRLIARMLFQVSATDPVTFAIIAAILVAVGMAASYVPAWRATRVDPVVALYGRP